MKENDSIERLLEFSFINIDKPAGPTSFQVSTYVKEMLEARKTSHLGTLDPPVSGVLPMAINRACKLSTYLMRKEKSYVGVMRLHEDVSDEVLKKEMSSFTGIITQLPPVRSSVKRAEREREVKKFEFIERDGKDVVFECDVEAGTYVRTLVNDLGKKIGGAHMLELRRTRAGIFEEKKTVNLYDIDKAIEAWKKGDEKLLREILIPAEKIIKQVFPIIQISDRHIDRILKGKPIHRGDVVKMPKIEKNAFVAVFCGENFVEIARVIDSRDVVAVPDFVFN